MAMDKPTEIAEDAFQFAKRELQNVKTTLEVKDGLDYHLRSALSEMAWGLQNACCVSFLVRRGVGPDFPIL